MTAARPPAPTRAAGSFGTRRAGATATAIVAVVAVAAALLASAVSLLVLGASATSASTLNGIATIAKPGTSGWLGAGGSTTPFTVSLPQGAACDGDTAHNGYHVYSYLVPQGTNLSTLTFEEATGPSTGYGIVDATGLYYGPINTGIGTGLIVGVPNNFDWAPLVTQDHLLTSLLDTTGGVWEAGLACANTSGALADNWNTEVTFTASGTDPNGFVWSDVPGPSGSTPAAFTSANNATFYVGASTPFTPAASGSPAPTITESGTLPTGVTFSGGVLGGAPASGTAGTFPIVFTATNGIESPARQSFILTVDVASLSVVTATTHTSYSALSQSIPYTYVVTNTGNVALSGVSVSASPAAATCPSSTLGVGANETCTGHHVITAANLSHGSLTDTATASATGPVAESSAASAVTIDAENCTEPVFTSAAAATVTARSAFTFTVTTCATAAPTITATGLPTGITLVNNHDGTASLSGDPAVTLAGAHTISLSAALTGKTTAKQSLVLSVDDAPRFSSANAYTAKVAMAFSFTVTTLYGYPLPTLSTTSTLPTGVHLTNIGSGKATLGGTPHAGTGGSYVLTLVATNGIGAPVDQTFTLTVDQLPVITSANSLSAVPGVAITPFYVTATGYPAPTFSATGLPAGLVLAASGKLSGTPTHTDTVKAYAVTIHATSAAGSTTQAFTLTLT